MMMTRTALAVLALVIAAPATWAQEVIDINLGYSQVVRPAEVPGTVIVGDDAVADATIGGGNTIILTGKALGTTNLIVLDEAGGEILSLPVTVAPVDRRPTATIRVVKGSADEQEYLCGPASGCSLVESGSGAGAPTMVAGGSTETSEPAAEPAPEENADTELQPE